MVSDASRNLMGASCELFGTGRKENPNMRETMEKMRKKTLKSPAISLFTTIKSEDNLPFFVYIFPLRSRRDQGRNYFGSSANF